MSPGIQERRIAAIVGALVADAAAQPIHWNYKVDKLDQLLKETDDVGFIDPSANPFYCLPVGSQSCYGDQSFTVLKSLVECKGMNLDSMVKAFCATFGPESSYENPVNAVYKIKTDVNNTKYPIEGPWRHFSIKDFLRNVDAGKTPTGSESDSQIDCAVRIVPAVALYAGSDQMLDKVEEVIRLTQNSDTSVAVGLAAARLLQLYILNGQSDDAVDHVIQELSNPNRDNPQDLDKALAGFLRNVVAQRDKPHIETARGIRID